MTDGSKSDKQDMNPEECDLSDCSSGSKGVSGQEEEACCSPTSSNGYNYPGCNGKSSQLDDQWYNSNADGDSYAGFQPDVSYGSEALLCYSGVLANEKSKSSTLNIALVKSNGFYSATMPLESKSQQAPVKSSSSKPMMENHCVPIKTWGKIDLGKGSQSVGKFSTEKPVARLRASNGSKSDKEYMNPGNWDYQNITSGAKGKTHKDSDQEEEACYPITNNYSDYNRNFSQLDDQEYTNTTSGCGSYANYDASEALPCYTSDPPNVEDLTNDMSKSSICENALVKPEIQFRPLKTLGKIGSSKRSLTAGKFPSFTSQGHVKVSQPADKFPPSISQNSVRGFQSARIMHPPRISQNSVKGFQPARIMHPPRISQNSVKGFQPARKFPRSIGHNQGNFVHNGSTNYQPNHNASNGSMYKSRYMNKYLDDVTRGPRIQNASNSNSPNVTSKDSLELAIERNKYNLEDFQTDYPDAKFYVIKSFSEDDVYKCIKFEVWASTRNGNKKLNDSFQDMMAKSYETGTKCPPTFLFFSVNGSGQFVGVAEMIGQVDFNKNMDFWQVDQWNGFFPVNWHIVKDIPNAKLRHIMLPNNENRNVTFTRDTHEIGLEQGLEMLKIFKNHEVKTSLLDDVTFYEDRIKLAREKEKNVKKESSYPETGTYEDYGEDDHQDCGEEEYQEYQV